MARSHFNSTAQGVIVVRDPQIMGGQPVFAGTRVPVTHLIDYLVGNYSIEEFTEHFPTVEREQIEELLQRIGDHIVNGDLQA
ncbi:MAG TPA: DUF433 domain-containing protein [Herpetosiphonaceae bacterium]|nr:DUF433 domain-containing protein [Herpetosiphonaceae bacterium]